MKTRLVVFALATMAFAGLAQAEKPVVKPYAAAAPYGGIPPWNPGEKFIGVSGSSCDGNCPVYELYVFDDGRVVFVVPFEQDFTLVGTTDVPVEGEPGLVGIEGRTAERGGNAGVRLTGIPPP